MGRPAVPDDQKKREGAKLREIWEREKGRLELTQNKLCDSIGLNQGLLQRYFKGSAPIPTHTLLDLARVLEFDPRDVRPEIEPEAKRVIRALEIVLFQDEVDGLTPEEQQSVRDYIRFLRRKGSQ